MRNNTGFTLIELLVVIVILGISLTFALLSFGDFGKSKQVIMAAEGLKNQIKLAQQQAILETSALGILINDKGYQVVRYQVDKGWHSLGQKGVFRRYAFPEGCGIKLITARKVAIGQPGILVNSTGEVSPFTLNFYVQKSDKIVTQLTVKTNGRLVLSRSQ